MLIPNGNGTYIGGPLDVWLILHNIHTKRFHPAFFEEKPFPGTVPGVKDVKVVRLASKMHHTTGFDTLEAAVKELKETLTKQLIVPVENVWYDEPVDWDGEIPLMTLERNWRG